MCKIFNDGMKYSERTKKFGVRTKRQTKTIEDYFNNMDDTNILLNTNNHKTSIEKASIEETIEKRTCFNYSHCYPSDNGVEMSPTEAPEQVGMTTDFAPQKILGPEQEDRISKEVDPDAIPWPKRWKYGIVPFFIDPKTYDTYLGETITQAFDYFEKATCIRLQRLRERPTDQASLQRVEWLYITNPTGIRQCVHTNDQKANNGVQMVVFGYDCMSLGEIVHEIMHVLGFSHEHVRPIRDKYVHILWNNIKPGYKKYFLTRKDDMLSHLPYDFSSVMHYPTRAFSRNGQHTIVSKSLIKIGQRDGLSETDTVKVNYVYSAECLKRNKQYLQTTCPVVIESGNNNIPRVVSQTDINKYFEDRLWPFGVVTYNFRDNMEFSIEERQNIAAVIRHIEKETCIRFHDASEKNEHEHDSNVDKEVNEDNNGDLNTDIENKSENFIQNSKENTPPEQTIEVTTPDEISRQGKGAKIKFIPKPHAFPNFRQPIVLSSIENDRNIISHYDMVLSDSSDDNFNNLTGGKQLVSKIRSGRRHSSNNIIFTRSDKPGCKCPQPGRPEGDKVLSISVDCFNSVNDLLHLFVHVLGLDHQHNMHDRNSYLHIMWDKLSEENKKDLSTKLPPAASLGYPYDYQSVMHYPWLEIKNGQSNIMYPIWNDGWAMGHWQGLSSTDVKKLNTLYADKCLSRKREATRT